ncbi:unnamed protein product, partial [Pleuronectes platessa]
KISSLKGKSTSPPSKLHSLNFSPPPAAPARTPGWSKMSDTSRAGKRTRVGFIAKPPVLCLKVLYHQWKMWHTARFSSDSSKSEPKGFDSVFQSVYTCYFDSWKRELASKQPKSAN